MSDRRSRKAAALALLLAIAPAIAARQEDPRERDGLRHRRPPSADRSIPAPEERPTAGSLPADLEWIQGGPLSTADLRGKVTLVEFWEATCIGCLRVAPMVERLGALYGPAGLVVIGVHTPEFGFSSDRSFVAAAVKRLGIGYPVVNDPHLEAWRAFDTIGWPSTFLIDGQGRLAWRGTGEGDSVGLEERVRALLAETGAVGLPTAQPGAVDPLHPVCGDTTSEVFVGHARGALANREGYAPGATKTYAPTTEDPPEGLPMLSGPWVARADGISRGAAGVGGAEGAATLTLVYRAREVYVVLHPLSAGDHTLEVTQDGAPLSAASKGADLQIDAHGRSSVTLDASRLYLLATNAGIETHRLELTPGDEQFQIISFAFANDCEASPRRR